MSYRRRRPSLGRNKWYRRGRKLTSFLLASLQLLVGAAAGLLIAIVRLVARSAYSVRDRWRKGRATSRRVSAGFAEGDSTKPKVQFEAISPDASRCVTFNDVAGLEQAKQEILVRTVLPVKHHAQRMTYRLETGGGVLLWGPPGCGKTLLARAVAGELGCAFFSIRASDLISQWVGQAEKNVAALFRRVRQERQAVLFLDEVDAVCPSRRKNRSTVAQRVVSEFLSQIDGVEQKSETHGSDDFLLLIGATNWLEAIDEALLRPGRFDVRVYVGLPGEQARHVILAKSLQGRPISADVSLDALVSRTTGFSAADLGAVVEATAQRVFMRAIQADTKRTPLCRDDFHKTLSTFVPSIAPAEIERYERMVREFLPPEGRPSGVEAD